MPTKRVKDTIPNIKRASVDKAIEKAEIYAAKKLHIHLEKLMELASGVLVMKDDDPDNPHGGNVYALPPDRQALQYLIDRGMGKPTDKIGLTGDQESGIVFVSFKPGKPSESET